VRLPERFPTFSFHASIVCHVQTNRGYIRDSNAHANKYKSGIMGGEWLTFNRIAVTGGVRGKSRAGSGEGHREYPRTDPVKSPGRACGMLLVEKSERGKEKRDENVLEASFLLYYRHFHWIRDWFLFKS
jgi:hypothetical protein